MTLIEMCLKRKELTDLFQNVYAVDNTWLSMSERISLLTQIRAEIIALEKRILELLK